MHDAAREWVATHTVTAKVVVDVGGRNVNGTVRDLFPGSDYTAIDIHDGPGVDVVGDFLDWAPPRKADCVVCTEVAEHSPQWREIIAHAAEILKVGGLFIFTAAGPGRAPHSAIDGGTLRDGEHYENVSPDALRRALDKHFTKVEVDVAGEDVRAIAKKGRK